MISKILRPLIPVHYRPIAAAQVAPLERTPTAKGKVMVLSGEMQRG